MAEGVWDSYTDTKMTNEQLGLTGCNSHGGKPYWLTNILVNNGLRERVGNCVCVCVCVAGGQTQGFVHTGQAL
jgi:hypothetical protein